MSSGRDRYKNPDAVSIGDMIRNSLINRSGPILDKSQYPTEANVNRILRQFEKEAKKKLKDEESSMEAKEWLEKYLDSEIDRLNKEFAGKRSKRFMNDKNREPN